MPWMRLECGDSFFVPCLDRKAHEKELLAEAKRLGMEVKCKQVVENGIYGLRLWRIK